MLQTFVKDNLFMRNEIRIDIDTSVTVSSKTRRKFLPDPKWGAVAGAFFIKRDSKPYVLSVKRTSETDYPDRWGLLSGGTCETKEELRNPLKALIREAREEVIILKNGELRNPLKFSNPISSSNMVREKGRELLISDRNPEYAEGPVPILEGDVYFTKEQALFWKPYFFREEPDKVFDGEKENNRYLNREVKFLSKEELKGRKLGPAPEAVLKKWNSLF